MPRQSTEYSLATFHPLPFVPETEAQNQDIAADHEVSVAAQSESCRGTRGKMQHRMSLIVDHGTPNSRDTARALVAEFGARSARSATATQLRRQIP